MNRNADNKVLCVGTKWLCVMNEQDIERLRKIRVLLISLGGTLQERCDREELINAIEFAIANAQSHLAIFNKNEASSLVMQKAIAKGKGFISYQEFIDISLETKREMLYETDDNLLYYIQSDMNFPDNKDDSWKSYRQIVNYIRKNENRYADFIQHDLSILSNSFSEYRAILRGELIP